VSEPAFAHPEYLHGEGKLQFLGLRGVRVGEAIAVPGPNGLAN
jgi:hypothetical protein